LSKAIYDLLKINELKDANIRVSVSRGISENRAFNISKSEAASVVITAQSFTPRPLKFYEFGIKIDTSQFRKSSSSLSVRFKTPSYLDSIVARNSSMSTGSYETIYLNESGYVCEGTVSNIFMVKDGNKLLTPSVNCGLLAGVTRKLILELSPFAGLAVTEGRFDLDTLKGSAEVFITNSIIELIPVVKVDESVIKSGLVGPVTKRLLDLYRECVNNETMEL